MIPIPFDTDRRAFRKAGTIAAAPSALPSVLRARAASGQQAVQGRGAKNKFLAAVLLCFAGTPLLSAEPVEIGSRRELFVEDTLIHELSGDARLELHHPVPRDVAMTTDKPWEGVNAGCVTVFRDGDLYRMYYRGENFDVSNGSIERTHRTVYCYAESPDGIQWKKPELGIIEFNGSKANNIVWDGVGVHNFSPFKDSNPDCPDQVRYKAVGSDKPGLFAFKSSDAIHWSLISRDPIITNGAFDSHNLAFWDPTIEKYRAYWRFREHKDIRAIRTATSSDFMHWDNESNLKYVDSPVEQLYTNQIRPCERAPHLLIGFPMRYVDRGWSDSTRALPERELRELRAKTEQRFGTAVTEVLLMASRDGRVFKRWNEAFLRPGIERPGTWQYGQQYVAWYPVETESSLPGAPPELSFYSTESGWHGNEAEIRRYTLRLDGFVSVNAPMAGGELITKPLIFDGSQLELNFSSSAAGGIRVEIQRADGQPVEGLTLDDCDPVFGDSLDRVVSWKTDAKPGDLRGQPVRLRFSLQDADLYSYRFK